MLIVSGKGIQNAVDNAAASAGIAVVVAAGIASAAAAVVVIGRIRGIGAVLEQIL